MKPLNIIPLINHTAILGLSIPIIALYFTFNPNGFNKLLNPVSPNTGEEHTKLESKPDFQETKGNLLIPRYGLSAATDGQWIYVFGGSPTGKRNGKDYMSSGLTSSIERIDPTTLKSKYYGDGLRRRANHATLYFNQKLITCGGRSQVGLKRFKLASCEYLDIETQWYRELPPLPDSIRTLGMAMVDEYIYVVGGIEEGAIYSPNTYRINLEDLRWERLEDAPFPVSGMIIPIKEELFAIGGYNGKAMTSVMVFNTKKLKWEKRKDLPYALSAYSAVSDGKSIYIFGDYVKLDVIHRYEPATGELYLLDQKMTPRRHTAAVLINDRAIVMGGNQTSSGNSLSTIEAFDLKDLKEGGEKISASNGN